MPSGGSRSRSGPAPDPNSGRSEKRGVVFSALPRVGFQGKVPEFPLPKMLMGFWTKDGEYIEDSDGEKSFADRERWLWEWAWRTPQAAVWDAEPWRQYSVAHWVRASVICEGASAKGVDRTTMLRLQEEIGLSDDALARKGWKIANVDPEPLKAVGEKPVRRERRLRGD